MRRWRYFVFMFLLSSILNSQILNETFDDNLRFLSSTPFFSNGVRAYFGITGESNDFGNDPVPIGLKEYQGFLGNYLTGMRLNGMGANLPVQIAWENLNIQGITELVFKGDFAEYVDEPGHIDAQDFILVEYQIDSQGYLPLLSFVGADFTTPSHNGVFREDTNFDGIGDGKTLNYISQRFRKQIPQTGNRLDLRISISVNAHEEDFAIDNIILTGKEVIDSTPPVIFCFEDLEIYTDLNLCGAFVDFSLPEAIDETDENPMVTQIAGPASGSFFEIGSNELIFQATDNQGNTSECSVLIHILDKQSPKVKCADSITVIADAENCQTIVYYDLPVVSDNCSALEQIEVELISGIGSGNSFPVGRHHETFLITDNVGNMSACSVIVEVLPEILPKLSCPLEPITVEVNKARVYLLPKLEGKFGILLEQYCGQRGVYTIQEPDIGTPLQIGLHEVEIQLFFEEELIDTCVVELSVQETLGIESNEKENFIVYPNPTSSKIFIQTTEQIKTSRLYSLRGKLLKKNQGTIISLDYLAGGTYLLEIETWETRRIFKIIKQ